MRHRIRVGWILPLVSLTLLALAAGCSRSTLPSAPLARPAALGPRSGGVTITATGEYEPGVLAWWPASGTAESDVESAYELTPVAQQGAATLCTLAPGQDPAAVAQLLSSDARVAWAEPNYMGQTAESRGHAFAFDDGFNDRTSYADQGAAGRVGLRTAHVAARGQGVVVAVLDTGVDPTHPLLASHLLPGYDFVDNDADPTEAPDGIDSDGDGLVDEALGHGSHVTGIVALVAPEAKILPVRVLDDDGWGTAYNIARGIDWARLHGARVINLSLGMLNEDHMVSEAIDRARLAGVVVVASAGNWGAATPEEYPARDEPTLAIAATDAADLPATFTSFGDFVALSAPGVAIRSAFWNGNTAVWSGTSMSAPWVSGGAALVLSAHPDWTPDQVLARLAATARPLAAAVPGATSNYGAGILDLAAALAPDLPGGSVDPEAGLARPNLRP